jgi:hypothetical protein
MTSCLMHTVIEKKQSRNRDFDPVVSREPQRHGVIRPEGGPSTCRQVTPSVEKKKSRRRWRPVEAVSGDGSSHMPRTASGLCSSSFIFSQLYWAVLKCVGTSELLYHSTRIRPLPTSAAAYLLRAPAHERRHRRDGAC